MAKPTTIHPRARRMGTVARSNPNQHRLLRKATRRNTRHTQDDNAPLYLRSKETIKDKDNNHSTNTNEDTDRHIHSGQKDRPTHTHRNTEKPSRDSNNQTRRNTTHNTTPNNNRTDTPNMTKTDKQLECRERKRQKFFPPPK